MDQRVDALCREIRVLRRGLFACALALVGLGVAFVWSQRSRPLAIGNVTIDDNGIAIVDGASTVQLDARSVRVLEQDKGGVALWPTEMVMNDSGATQAIRMRVWSSARAGEASVVVESVKQTGNRTVEPISNVRMSSTGRLAGVHATASIFDKQLIAGEP